MIIAALLALAQTPGGVSVESVFARDIPARTRSLIRVDPVELELIENRLDPAKGWTSRESVGWSFKPSGYVWVKVLSPKAQVMHLNASGVSMFYMNGEPRVGDVYGYGSFFVPVPLKRGVNDVLLYGFRGDAKLNWRLPKGSLEIDAADATLPDFNSDTKKPYGDRGSVVVLNNSSWARKVRVRVKGRPMDPDDEAWIPAYGVIKFPFSGITKSEVMLVGTEGSKPFGTRALKLDVRKAGEPYRFTFQSAMDGSVQYAAVNPASDPNARVTVLSLHGASVEAIGQAQAYGQKDFCNIVCPTNRRPFGFNWEGIGRRDALEALHAASDFTGDPKQVVLTGHSMGGHGAWHLGVHHANMFAAVAPCAGWISFDTYAGGANYDLKDPMQALLNRANIASDTLKFKKNLAQTQSVFIHHGEADETVPVTEARRMRDELKGIVDVQYHEEPGAGHWFDKNPEPGADSVDWKPMMELFRTAKSPEIIKKFDLTLGDLRVQSGNDFASVTGQVRRNDLTKLTGELRTDGWHFQISNANEVNIAVPKPVHLNGQLIEESKVHEDAYAWRLQNGRWQEHHEEDRMGRGDLREYMSRAFLDIYNSGVRFIVPNDGPAEERAWAWQKARYDMEQMWYRGNATPRLELASNFQIDENWSVFGLYYGYAAKQTAVANWSDQNRKLPPGSAFFEVLHSAEYMYCQIGGTDVKGRRLAERFPLFSPGVSYPDYFAANIKMLSEGASGIIGAGYLGPDGSAKDGEWVWRD